MFLDTACANPGLGSVRDLVLDRVWVLGWDLVSVSDLALAQDQVLEPDSALETD